MNICRGCCRMDSDIAVWPQAVLSCIAMDLACKSFQGTDLIAVG